MTLTRESLEAARADIMQAMREGASSMEPDSQNKFDATIFAINACLSAWPAESAVEAAAEASWTLDQEMDAKRSLARGEAPYTVRWKDTNRIDRSDWLALTEADLLAAGLHTNARIAELEAENARLNTLINSPETQDWMKGVPLEAAHQIERWGADHDAGKAPLDWFWLIGYLAQKAATSAMAGNADKAKHHTISTGAALLNWHRSLTGENTLMRPGIDPGQALKGTTP